LAFLRNIEGEEGSRGDGAEERPKPDKNDTEKRANLGKNDTENAKVVKKSVD